MTCPDSGAQCFELDCQLRGCQGASVHADLQQIREFTEESPAVEAVLVGPWKAEQ